MCPSTSTRSIERQLVSTGGCNVEGECWTNKDCGSSEIRRNNPNNEAPGLLDDRNPRQRNKPRNRLKNIQNTDAMGNDVSGLHFLTLKYIYRAF